MQERQRKWMRWTWGWCSVWLMVIVLALSTHLESIDNWRELTVWRVSDWSSVDHISFCWKSCITKLETHKNIFFMSFVYNFLSSQWVIFTQHFILFLLFIFKRKDKCEQHDINAISCELPHICRACINEWLKSGLENSPWLDESDS